MANLNYAEKQILEETFEMKSGYVLNCDNYTFKLFISAIVDYDVYERYQGISKADILRRIFNDENDKNVGNIIIKLLQHKRDDYKDFCEDENYNKSEKIGKRLLSLLSNTNGQNKVMTNKNERNVNDIYSFKVKEYRKIKNLGKGAVGEVFLLKDEVIDMLFACKEYLPISEHPNICYENFVKEIKCLYLLHHKNVVRVYDYHLYPDEGTGFIVMEYIDGIDIENYVSKNADKLDVLFEQAIEAFAYIHSSEILHRDIRSKNILITDDGILKVIDFGFGKKIDFSTDKLKSVTLNWIASPPDEFKESRYDFQTEVYFIGALFNSLISNNDIEHSKYQDIIDKMIQKNPAERITSFTKVKSMIYKEHNDINIFTEKERLVYKEFADKLLISLNWIHPYEKYQDIQEVISNLRVCYQNNMLEERISNRVALLECFVFGEYS